MMTETEVTKAIYKQFKNPPWTLTKVQFPELPFTNDDLPRWVRPFVLDNNPKATRPGSDFKVGLLIVSIFVNQTTSRNLYYKDEVIDALMTQFQNKTVETENGSLRFLQINPRPVPTKEENLLMYDVEIPFQVIET